jgi:hypothetical protein
MTERTKHLLQAIEYEEKMMAETDPAMETYYRKHRDLCVEAAYASSVAPLYVKIGRRETFIPDRRIAAEAGGQR